MPTAIAKKTEGNAPTLAHNPQRITAKLMSNLVTTQTLDERLYWVAPVVLIVEGVHNGLYYPAEELAKFPDAWNGSPLPVFHPEDDQGNFMTANDPGIVERQNIGTLYNVRFEDGKLKGDAWIDQEKAQNIAPEVVTVLQSGNMLEVSTGLYLEVIQREGDFNGEHYTAIAVNYRPDHLALLPGGKGACSVADGAGLPRVNEDEDMATRKKTHEEKRGELIAKYKERLDVVFDESEKVVVNLSDSITNELSGNELSHTDIRRQIEGAIEKFEEDEAVLVREIFDNFFVYEHIRPMTDEPSQLFKQAYAVDAQDQITMNGEPIEVRKKTDFVPVTANEEEESTEQKEETTMDRDKVIDALIANDASAFTEDDREFLIALSDERLQAFADGLTTNKGTTDDDGEEKKAAKTETTDGEDKPEAKTAKNAQEWLDEVPADIREQFEEGKSALAEKRAELVSTIKANSQNPYSDEDLDAMPLTALKKSAQLAKPQDYSGARGGTAANAQEDEGGLSMPTMAEEKSD